ncbi:MAG: putative zinc-binding metallopeptidase [Candidatus Peribacteraceae bacterium]|nr:putative zinc-binding metallopeptidase [Candidatus Peribacteraceae bacterium]
MLATSCGGSILTPDVSIAEAYRPARQYVTGVTPRKRPLLSYYGNAIIRGVRISVTKPKIAAGTITPNLSTPATNPSPNTASDTSPLLPVVNQSTISLKHRMLADTVLRSLQPECLSALKNFYVRYDHPTQRGLAGKSSIIIDGSVSDSEFMALVVHEFGHVTDLGCVRGNSSSGESVFRDGSDRIYADDPSVSFYTISWSSPSAHKSGTQAADFVSGYAAWDPFEDFAETYAYYILQRPAFAARARENDVIARKFQWMKEHVNINDIATGLTVWNGTVPWDVTKLAYSWKGNPSLAQRGN